MKAQVPSSGDQSSAMINTEFGSTYKSGQIRLSLENLQNFSKRRKTGSPLNFHFMALRTDSVTRKCMEIPLSQVTDDETS